MGFCASCNPTEMLGRLLGLVCGRFPEESENVQREIRGTVVLKKKNSLDIPDLWASTLDRIFEVFGKGVSMQLISSIHVDPATGKGKLGKAAYLGGWLCKFTAFSSEAEIKFSITFPWDNTVGVPGAFIIRNHHHSQFYLKSVTLEDIPEEGPLHFVCNSWVYPAKHYQYDRIFFTNKTYIPYDTPEPLLPYRHLELQNLRGVGHVSGMLKEWDRVYDYAYYNDLGAPEKGDDQARPVLGGSNDYPYPRRGKTARQPNKRDPNTESRLCLLNINIYIPRDEKFSQVKFSDFIGYALKSLGQVLVPEILALFDRTRNEFDTFQDVLKLYNRESRRPESHIAQKIRECIPCELLKELLRSDGGRFHNLPLPDVIKENETAWRTDEEFGREMLAGVNPVVIRRLQEFPPTSRLNPQEYGDHQSTITKEHIEANMSGLTVDNAIAESKLFILDHHDALMPYLRRINTTTTKTYATRTVLLLQDNGTLQPLAIELSLPHEDGDLQGPVSEVFTPSENGVQGSIWQLAKAYVAINDSGYHQLISHWLNTHAVIEPFIIATNRQLSVMHPIFKLLQPHFRDTMNINALARQALINAGGVLEKTVFPARYAMEMSSVIYKNWNFIEQGLPEDLLKRKMAVEDASQPHGLKLVIEDYPYAVDGLEIWFAIETWVKDYCNLYYPTNEKIEGDSELQSWWKELCEVGHGDLRGKPWWPKMQTQDELAKSCTIIIWVASALHAAVNFGQYAYAGYLPNRPTVSRRFMPREETPEYAELEENPEVAFLKTITAQFQTLLGVSLIEILSRHSTDEIYLGQRETPEWTTDSQAKQAFERFSASLVDIENRIQNRNNDETLRNRSGPVNMQYKFLYPNTSDNSKHSSLDVKGIPNSISI